MANDATPVLIPAISLVHGSQAPTKVTSESSSGKSLPSGGRGAAAPAASASKSTANGAVIADYPVIAFPALAKSLGISSALIDEHA